MDSKGKTPRSVAIIMDGNGRWAQSRGLERLDGHIEGVEAVRRTIEAAVRVGIEYLTLYAFSTENWGRPDSEVNALMELMGRCITNEIPDLKEKGVKVLFIGDMSKFEPEMQQDLIGAEKETAMGERLTLLVALNYSSRDELTRAMKGIAQEVKAGEIDVESINEELISSRLDTRNIPDPDLIIRTSGEMRLSNFLMWQASYAEFYFPEVFWPDFNQEELSKAIEVYKTRKRRFGILG